MSLDTASGIATVALACTIVTFVIVRLWLALTQSSGKSSHFPNSVMLESGQRFRDKLAWLQAEQSSFLILTLVFLVTACMAALLDPGTMIGDLPTWLDIALLTVVTLVAVAMFYRVAVIQFRKRRLVYRRDANIAVGHHLHALTDNRNRAFHDVICASGIVDHVVVGMQGIYAIFVVARKPSKDNHASLSHSDLHFAGVKAPVPLAEFGTIAKQLAKRIQQDVGHTIRVKPVIAVPGWEIDSQASENFLLVNERNLTMIRGWRDESDYLMDDEVTTIQELLRQLCMRSAIRKNSHRR